MKILKILIGSYIFPLLYYSGIFNLCLKFAKRNFVIIMYHGINSTEKKFDFNSRHIKLNIFQRHLKYFKKNFDIISLEELHNYLTNKKQIKNKKVILTFDDGYKNNLHACELAQQYQIPITIFITTSNLEDTVLTNYPDKLDFILLTTKEKELNFAGKIFNIADVNSRVKLKCHILNLLKTQNAENKKITFKELEDKLKPDYSKMENMREFFEFLKEEDVRELKNNKYVEIASHTVTHDNLENLTIEEVEDELTKSKEKLEQLTDKEIHFLSYPDGSYNRKTIDIAKKYYKLACAVEPRFDKTGENIFELRRLGFSTLENFYHHIFLVVLEFWRKI